MLYRWVNERTPEESAARRKILAGLRAKGWAVIRHDDGRWSLLTPNGDEIDRYDTKSEAWDSAVSCDSPVASQDD